MTIGPARQGATWRPSLLTRLVSLSPFAISLYVNLFAQTYFNHIFTAPPAISGIALGVLVQGAMFLWAAIGALAVWRSKSPMRATLALIVFTTPSIFGILLTPALILIMQNLG